MEAESKMEQAPIDVSVFFSLSKAVAEGNADDALKFLDLGVNPNYLVQENQSLLQLALAQKHMEIVRLLILRGAMAEPNFMRDVFNMADDDATRELLDLIVGFKRDDAVFMQYMFMQLADSGWEGTPVLNNFRLLLDNGLQIYSGATDFSVLHHSVFKDRIDFVELLLEYGADINLKSQGFTPLHLAVMHNYENIIDLLLRNGAQVNEVSPSGDSAMHYAVQVKKGMHVIFLLLEKDVDLNIVNNNNQTPLMLSPDWWLLFLFKKLSKSCYDKNIPACPENIEFLRSINQLDRFEGYMKELKKMKHHVVYKGITLLDILYNMPEKSKKLTYLTKNENFVAKYWTSWNRELYKNYSDDLDKVFRSAVQRRDILQMEEKKLQSIFKGTLPELVIDKIAFFNKERLFFKNQ